MLLLDELLETPESLDSKTELETVDVMGQKVRGLDNQQPSSCAKVGEGSETRERLTSKSMIESHSVQCRKDLNGKDIVRSEVKAFEKTANYCHSSSVC